MNYSAGCAEGIVFDIDRFALHDGPGIRMAVYFKGCPLSCGWCHSPESQRPDPEVIYMKDRCVTCGLCRRLCDHDVHVLEGDKHELRRDACVVCGQCVDACPSGALEIKGESMSAAAIVDKAVRMKPFFAHSGGGVTLTGGEFSLQHDFARSVLEGLRREGIHSAVETCGMGAWEKISALTEFADLVLYDLKLIDESEHKHWTGCSNAQILDNLCRMDTAKLIVRVPLVPGITDTEPNLRGIFAFMQQHGLERVELLPYNVSAGAKYEWLGRECAVSGEPHGAELLDQFNAIAANYGIHSRSVG